MNNGLALKTITFKDMWNVFRGCFAFVLVAAILATGVTYAYAKFTYVPSYSSTATVYLIDKGEGVEGEESEEFDINKYTRDYAIALRVIPDVMFILKSSKVTRAVSEELGYSVSGSNISITNPEETRVLQITATASSPEKAQEIVNCFCEVGAIEIEEMIQYNKMYIYQQGGLNKSPSNVVSLMSYIKFGLVAAVLVFAIFLAMFLFDNYIHTEEDVERYLGLTILGDIPDANAPKKKNKYSRYSEEKYKSSRQYYKADSGEKKE